MYIIGRIEDKWEGRNKRLLQRNEEYIRQVAAGDVPFEPPPLDAQINYYDHNELIRLAAVTDELQSQHEQSQTATASERPSSSGFNGATLATETERGGVLIAGNVELQLAGKKKSKRAVYAFILEAELYFGQKEGEPLDNYQVIPLDGCHVRLAEEEQTKLRNAIEIFHPNHKLYERCDYVYIQLRNDKELERWYLSLLTICGPAEEDPRPKAEQSSQTQSQSGSATPQTLGTKRQRMSRAWQEFRGYKPVVTADSIHGWLRIQKEDDITKVVKRFCSIRGRSLLLYASDKIYATTPEEIDLAGCLAEQMPDTKKMKNAIKLSRKGWELSSGTDFIYVITEDDVFLPPWLNALQEAIRAADKKPSGPASSSGSPSAGTPVEPNADATATDGETPAASGTAAVAAATVANNLAEELRAGLEIESTSWLNAILSRFFLNLREAQDVLDKVKNVLETKMKTKLSEKKLSGYLEKVDVISIEPGTTPPTITGVKLIPQKRPGELGLDFHLHYKGTAHITFSGMIMVTAKTSIPFIVTATLRSLSGKLYMHCAPWPAERFSLSFYTEPKLDIHLESLVGEKRQMRNFLKVNDLILVKLRTILIEKAVMPNRRYIPIPKARKYPLPAQVPQSGAASPTTAVGVQEAEGKGKEKEIDRERSSTEKERSDEELELVEIAKNGKPEKEKEKENEGPSSPKKQEPGGKQKGKETNGTEEAGVSEPLPARKPRESTGRPRALSQPTEESETRRKAIVESILGSERVFVESLLPLVKLYSEEMFVELSELHDMFGRVMVIYNYHSKIVRDLERRLAHWNLVPPNERLLADIFLQLAEFTMIEKEYSSNHAKYCEQIRDLSRRNSRFNEFLKTRERDGEDSFEDLLEKPVLRSVFYQTLLEELIGCTPTEHPDSKALRALIKHLAAVNTGPIDSFHPSNSPPSTSWMQGGTKAPRTSLHSAPIPLPTDDKPKKKYKQWLQEKMEKAAAASHRFSLTQPIAPINPAPPSSSPPSSSSGASSSQSSSNDRPRTASLNSSSGSLPALPAGTAPPPTGIISGAGRASAPVVPARPPTVPRYAPPLPPAPKPEGRSNSSPDFPAKPLDRASDGNSAPTSAGSGPSGAQPPSRPPPPVQAQPQQQQAASSQPLGSAASKTSSAPTAAATPPAGASAGSPGGGSSSPLRSSSSPSSPAVGAGSTTTGSTGGSAPPLPPRPVISTSPTPSGGDGSPHEPVLQPHQPQQPLKPLPATPTRHSTPLPLPLPLPLPSMKEVPSSVPVPIAGLGPLGSPPLSPALSPDSPSESATSSSASGSSSTSTQ